MTAYSGPRGAGGGGDVTDLTGIGKGELVTGDGVGTVVLPVGANGTVLVADSGATDGIKWAVVSGTGDVVGPGSATDNAIARYDGTTGKLIQNSGATIDDSGNITATNLSGTNTGNQTITLTGDVTGTGTGSFAATIANSAVTYAKIQNVSVTDRILGRSTAGAGVVEEIQCTAAGRALIDDPDAGTQRNTLGLGSIATQNANNVSISGGIMDNTIIGGITPANGTFTSLIGTTGAFTTATVTRGATAGVTGALAISDAGTSTGSSLTIAKSGTSYGNASGALNIVRSGSFTFSPSNYTADLHILPTVAITAPSSTGAAFGGVWSDLSGVSVTAAAGTVTTYASYFKACADADSFANYALYCDTGLIQVNNNITFGSAVAAVSTEYNIGKNASNQIQSNIASGGGGFLWSINGVAKMQLNASANFTLTPTAAAAGTPTLFTITAPAHTGLSASTEAVDVNLNLGRTVTFSTGAFTTQRAVRVQAPTYAFASASTITNCSTFDINGAPSAGSNATITNAVGLAVGGNTSQTPAAGLMYSAINVPVHTVTLNGTTQVTTSRGISGVSINQITVSNGSASTVDNASSMYIANAPSGGGAGPVTITNAYALFIDAGAARFDGRVLKSKGADVASANDLTLGADGNTFVITGTTQINAITTTRWQAGAQIVLIFSGALTLKHNTAGGANTAPLLLQSSTDLTTAANTVVPLVFDGTNWQQISPAKVA